MYLETGWIIFDERKGNNIAYGCITSDEAIPYLISHGWTKYRFKKERTYPYLEWLLEAKKK